MTVDPRLHDYYADQYAERLRLGRREGQLERARTQELLRRMLPPAPATLLDVGGGTGVYAGWLAGLGYTVHLVDVVPGHALAAAQSGTFTASVGDARALPAADAVCDAVLLLGPLYHLLDPADRQIALAEARRVLRPGGLLAAAFITRGAVALDGYVKGWIDKPGVIRAVQDHLRSGVSPEHASGFGTIAVFHLPGEARAEVAAAGFAVTGVYGIEGPGWVAPDFAERWQRAEAREVILATARVCEEIPELQALSPHLLVVAHRA